MLNIREMLTGRPSRLRYVLRWSTVRVHRPESVAEHCFYVALYSHLIGMWYSSRYREVEVHKDYMLGRAILHDMDESETGDIPRGFKYSRQSLKQRLDEVAAEAAASVANHLWESNPHRVSTLAFWRMAKNNDVEGRIVEFADFLSVLSYVFDEINSGNLVMLGHLTALRSYYEKFLADEFLELRPLIDEAGIILREVMRKPT